MGLFTLVCPSSFVRFRSSHVNILRNRILFKEQYLDSVSHFDTIDFVLMVSLGWQTKKSITGYLSTIFQFFQKAKSCYLREAIKRWKSKRYLKLSSHPRLQWKYLFFLMFHSNYFLADEKTFDLSKHHKMSNGECIYRFDIDVQVFTFRNRRIENQNRRLSFNTFFYLRKCHLLFRLSPSSNSDQFNFRCIWTAKWNDQNRKWKNQLQFVIMYRFVPSFDLFDHTKFNSVHFHFRSPFSIINVLPILCFRFCCCMRMLLFLVF